MTSCIATTPSEGILDKPILYPIKLVLTPLFWAIHKIKRTFKLILGYLLTLAVFSNGKHNTSWFSRALISIYRGGWYDTHARASFDPNRLKNAFKVLENVGGIRTETITRDGHILDSMLIRYKDVKAEIEKHGGKFLDCLPVKESQLEKKGKEYHLTCKEDANSTNDFIDVIIPDPAAPDCGWDKFCEENLSKLGLETCMITMEDGRMVKGFVTKHWMEKNPKRTQEGLCFARANAPTENFPMGKRDIMRRVLGLRADEYCFDYRGSGISHGVPTEGGYYLDIEAAVEKIRDFYGYDLSKVVVDGFCLGAAVAMHAKQKYHDEGINLFIQNGFCCLDHTAQNQFTPVNHLASFAHTEVRSRDPLVDHLLGDCGQDHFNSVGKLHSLNSKKGTTIIINTDTDTLIDSKSHERLKKAAKPVSEHFFSILFKGEKGKNGHSFDVLSDHATWNRVCEHLTSIKPPPTLCA